MTRLAAIPYESDFGIDAFMQAVVARLRRGGLRLGGVIQHNDAACADRCMAMSLEDLADGRRFPISQDLGASAQGCRLDPAGLEIFWGAYLGMPEEILLAGPLAEIAPRIAEVRAAARARHGWIMDTYLLRRRSAA